MFSGFIKRHCDADLLAKQTEWKTIAGARERTIGDMIKIYEKFIKPNEDRWERK